MSKQFKTIQSYDTTLGGTAWRATSNGEQVNVQSRSEGSNSWVTQRQMTAEAFEVHADEVGMRDVYNQNPAHLAHLASED